MNQKEKIDFLKNELAELEIQENSLNESLNLVKIRYDYFYNELVNLGIVNYSISSKIKDAVCTKVKVFRKKTDAQIKCDFMNSIK